MLRINTWDMTCLCGLMYTEMRSRDYTRKENSSSLGSLTKSSVLVPDAPFGALFRRKLT